MSSERPEEQDPDRVIIRDKRRFDPTGEPRVPDPSASAPDPVDAPDPADAPAPETLAEAAASAEVSALEAALEERTADLQRLQAEYANYRKRVDRDRILVGELAVGRVLADLLPVLDDIDRARDHGDLDGPFKAVGDKLHDVLARVGVEAFGEVGDPFDPSLHEAVMHDESTDVAAPTATSIMRKGYRQGERLLRPAMVGVTDPSAAQSPDSE